jgi:hypothetical protein
MDNPLSNFAKVMTKAPPPPPSEVKIRTMRSDIDSMMRSGGGGSPSFQNVAVSGLTMEKEYKGASGPVISAMPMASTPVAARPSPPSASAPVASAAPTPAPAPQPAFQEEPAKSSSNSNLVPIVIVVLVAVVAIAVVGYFAYTIFK